MAPLGFIITGLPAAIIILAILVIIIAGIITLTRASFRGARRLARRDRRVPHH
jgi:hypothetical protein